MSSPSSSPTMKMDSAVLQQLSQFLLLQSLASESARKSTISNFQQMPNMSSKMPILPNFPSIPSSLSMSPPSKMPLMPTVPTMSPLISPSNQSIPNMEAIEALTKILSAHQNLKYHLSPTSSTPSLPKFPQMPSFSPLNNANFRSSPYQLPSNQQQQIRQPEYRIAVTRESAQPLQDWMAENISHPYPTPADIQMLSSKTGFTNKQIRNWFTNNRRRYEQSRLNQPLPWQKKSVSNRKSPSPEFSTPASSSTSENCSSPTLESIKSLIPQFLNQIKSEVEEEK